MKIRSAKKSTKLRFALLSHTLPPNPSGQAVAIYRILASVHPESYYLIGSREVPFQAGTSNETFQLDAECYFLPPESIPSKPNPSRWGQLLSVFNILVRVYIRTRNILGILRRESSTTAIVVCTGDLLDVPAGFLASRIAHIPFYAYIFDDYVFQWTGKYRLFARFFAPLAFQRAAGIIGPNEFLCKEYQRRYRKNVTLVRNPYDPAELAEQPRVRWPFEDGKIRILYTGAIYHANYDCFRNLIQALEGPGKHNLELHIFTSQTRTELEGQGVRGNHVLVHPHLPYREVLEEQRHADILFLPLAFASPIPEVIRTSAPGKMGEYLASGRPVLAHIPPDSFVAYYFRLHACGAVADQNDVDSLSIGVGRILDDHDFRTSIIRNAQNRARLDFSPQLARDQFMTLLSG